MKILENTWLPLWVYKRLWWRTYRIVLQVKLSWKLSRTLECQVSHLTADHYLIIVILSSSYTFYMMRERWKHQNQWLLKRLVSNPPLLILLFPVRSKGGGTDAVLFVDHQALWYRRTQTTPTSTYLAPECFGVTLHSHKQACIDYCHCRWSTDMGCFKLCMLLLTYL